MVKRLTILPLTIALLATAGCQSTLKTSNNSNNAQVMRGSSSTNSTVSNNANKQQTESKQKSLITNQTQVITQYASVDAIQMAKRNPDLSILVEVLEGTGLTGMITFAGNDYTIFAPNNAAFEAFFSQTNLTKQKLLNNKSLLRSILAYHVVKEKGPLLVTELPYGQLSTIGKKKLTVTPERSLLDGKGRTVRIVKPNIVTKTGTVHVIDRVMFPAS